MNATVKTRDLIKALTQISTVSSRRATLPILSHMLMEFSNNKLTISSMNLQEALQVTYQAQADAPFRTAVPKSTVAKFINSDSPTTLFTTGKERHGHPTLIISQPDIGRMIIETAKPEDFPPMSTIPTPDWHTFDAKWLCRMLDILQVSCATDESRPVLTGISLKDGEMATADGFRLTLVRSVDKLNFGLGTKGVIIPSSVAVAANKLFAKEASLMVAIDTHKSLVQFLTKDTLLTSTLIQGAYPNYNQLVPATFSSRLSVSAPLLVQRLKMIDTESLSSEIVRLFTKEEGILEIQAGAEELADYEMRVPAKTDGKDFKIAMRYKYLVDAVTPFSLCNLEVNNPSSPMKVTGDIEELTVIAMPMLIQW